MASNTEDPHRRSSRAFWTVLAFSAILVVMIAGAALTVSPSVARASQPVSWAVVNIAKPTSQPLTWSLANIAKPTYTPTATPVWTATPNELPTASVSLMDVSGLLNDGSNPPSTAGKYILVSISEQHLTAYENGQLIYSFVASTGMHNGTRAGTFSVLDKIPNAYGSTWDIWMPDWLGIYYSGGLENGIHALPILPGGDRLWSGFLGTPISFGCVVLGVNEALQLYNWADVGTPVKIVW
jgi:lipoprotein-anchoring transpeptidase ErfK/SrfK